jgi:DNA-binding NarL/FixJ family response regulator/tetratricopeptide (TPR) repeat protein
MLSKPVYCRRFIGRRAQLDHLAERLRDTLGGRGSFVLVSGEAGIGKSRLLAEAREAFLKAGGRAVTGRCYQYVQSPYAPFTDLLSALDRELPEVLQSSAVTRRAVAPLRSESDGTGHAASSEEKRRLFDGVADAFRAFSARAPLMLAIEDLHWADDGSLSLLQHVAPTTHHSRIEIVCTYRSDELHRRHPLRPVVARLQTDSNVWQIPLEPLGDAEVRTLIAYSVEDRSNISAEISDSVTRLAEGNPFFAEELLKNAIDAPSGSKHPPLSVAQAVVERAAALDESDRYLLNCAALLDHGFTPGIISSISGRSEAETIETIKRAIGLQLLVEEENGDVDYAFRHALTREVLRDELLVGEQRKLHARIAEILEASPASRQRIADLAHHYFESRNLAKSAEFNARAADAAAQVGAYSDAARCYERALDGTENAGQRAVLYEKLAQTLYYHGAFERARRAYDDAIRLYEEIGDGESATQTRVAYARFCYNIGHPAAAFELLRQALDICERHLRNGPVHFSSLATLGGLCAHLGQVDEALEYLEQADRLDVRRKREDERLFYESRSIALAKRAQVRESAADCASAVAIARELSDAPGVNRILGNFGTLMADVGERDLSLEALEKARAGFRAYGIGGTGYATFLNQYAGAHYHFGDLAKARWAIGEWLALPRQTIRSRADFASVAIPVGIALEEQDVVDAGAETDILQYAISEKDADLEKCSAFALLYESRDEHERARELLKTATETYLRSAPGPLDNPWIFVQAAATGDEVLIGLARAATDRLRPISVRRDIEAYVKLVDALTAKKARNAERSADLATEAWRIFSAYSRVLQQAYALEVAGARREALDLYRAAGDFHDAHRLERALTPVNRRGRPKNALTAREEEVAKLLALGKSNRAIADALVVGERTVETHVASILSKLGASSRAEVAAVLAQREGDGNRQRSRSRAELP